ncbi:MAG: hypothetical protein ABGW78_04675, partial [Pirellulales bacterium]
KGHVWNTEIKSRGVSGNGCPQCNESRGEKAIKRYLEMYDFRFRPQMKFKECKDKLRLPFDFGVYVGKQLRLIEFQDEQHYRMVTFGSTPLKAKATFKLVKLRDRIKRKYCKREKIPLLIIPHWEIDNITALLDEFLGREPTSE